MGRLHIFQQILTLYQRAAMKNKEKIWRYTNNRLKRKSSFRETRHRILIVCEGEKTEPNYFNGFPIKREDLDLRVEGKGFNCVSLVEETIKLSEEAAAADRPYNQVWCVFDKDNFTDDQFNKACIIASNKHIRVAYSNEAFELWYLLHFIYFDSAITRNSYIDKLEIHLKHKYAKNSKNMYNELKGLQHNALKNAKKLQSTYKALNPAKNNPSTKVYMLVEALNAFMRGNN
jgi:hypothetical protein